MSESNRMREECAVFSKRLRMAMDYRKIKVKDMGIEGVCEISMSNYRCGTHMPNLKLAIEIAKRLNVSLDWLAGLSDVGGIPETKETEEKADGDYQTEPCVAES